MSKIISQFTPVVPKAGDLLLLELADGSAYGNFDAESYILGQISKTHAEAVTLKGANGLIVGKQYLISDKGIVITATEINQFTLEGSGEFIVPDYSANAVWVSNTGGGSYLTGDDAIYNGLVYNNDTGTNTDTTPPSDAHL